MGWRAGGRHRAGGILRAGLGARWRLPVAATLRRLSFDDAGPTCGVSISSPPLSPRGGKLPQWRPPYFESSSRISTRKRRSVQSLVAALRIRFKRAP